MTANMYRMPEKPPELPLNDYIVEYKRSGDGYWLTCFLHRVEPMLSGWAFRLSERYGQQRHVEDIKQEIVAALLGKVDAYDPAVGTSLLQFAKRDILSAVHAYIRQNGGTFAVPESRYKTLRRVNAIYYKHGELSVPERIHEVAEQTGLSLEKVKRLIAEGEQFRFSDSLDAEEQTGEYEQLKNTPDIYSSPDYLVPRFMLYDAFVDEIEKLRHKDYMLLMDYLGIDCLHCGRVHKEPPLADIADKHQLRDEQSVTNRFRKIIDGIRTELKMRGWIE